MTDCNLKATKEKGPLIQSLYALLPPCCLSWMSFRGGGNAIPSLSHHNQSPGGSVFWRVVLRGDGCRDPSSVTSAHLGIRHWEGVLARANTLRHQSDRAVHLLSKGLCYREMNLGVGK